MAVWLVEGLLVWGVFLKAGETDFCSWCLSLRTILADFLLLDC